MQRPSPTKVILDTDPGVDDALAILLALASPELEVVGITTVCGNVPVGQATKNLFRVLNLVKTPPALLVGQGAARPLEEELVTAVQVHGSDGLGELDSVLTAEGALRYPSVRLPSVLSTAQDVWSECVRRYPDEVTLITLGPLTNVALGLKVNPLTVQKFRSIIVMGGAIGVPGNIAPVTRERLTTWAAESCDPLGRITTDMTRKAFEFAETVEGHGLFYFHDPLTVLAAADSSLLKVEPFHVAVEMVGRVSRGMTVADRRLRRPEEKMSPNMRVAVDVDVDRALRLLRSRLCPWS